MSSKPVLNCDKWSIMHTNIRGFDSKVLSLQTMVDGADIVTINETFLKNNRKLRLPGFTCYNRNRINVHGGGIATCVNNKDAIDTLKVSEGLNEEEFLVTRHGQFATAINVINIYGQQECRTGREKLKESWGNILKEIVKIETKGELIVVIGDLNRHVGDIIEGNEKDKTSFGGQQVKDLIDTGKYTLVNATNKVVGGPYTRYMIPLIPKMRTNNLY